MKHFNFKLSIFLCLLVLGLESAIAQGIKITTNYTLGYQNSSDHNWCNFSNLNVGINKSDWCSTVEFNDGDLTGTSRLVNRHHNLSTRAGENFDWFTLTYTTPSYSKITYRLNILLQTWTSTLNVSRVRIAYFDYGTDPHGYWSSRNADPSGYTNFRTAAGAVDQSLQGEYFHAMSYKSAKSTTRTSTIDVTIDNNNGDSDNTSYRYGGFSCSKIASTSFNHSGEMWMGYEVISEIYYKHITYKANGGVGADQVQVVASDAPSTLKPADTFTRKNHIFTGWSEAKYAAGANVTASKDDKGPRTLAAQWRPVQFTFMNGTTAVGEALSANDDNSLPTLAASYKPTAGDNKFFVGYFTEEGGKGIKVYDGSLNATEEGKAVNFEADANLYAHFITTKHTVIWDYTYRDEDGYKSLDDHNRNCQVQFLDKNGVAFKTVFLTAPEVTNVVNPTSSNRTTATVNLDLAVGDSEDVTTGANAKIYFSQADIERIHSYQFDVWSTNSSEGTKAEFWRTLTNPITNTIHFSYGKLSENMFMLKWNVTLHDLNKYPDKIYAKPMILVGENYVEIDEMTGSIGEDCYMISSDVNRTEVGANTSRTYYGEFPVLKNQTGSYSATYKVGMTGFYLASENYFLDPSKGNVPDDFISNKGQEGLHYQDDTQDPNINTITYAIHDYDIPVVQMLPANPELGATGATINYKPMILYVDEARAKKVNLGGYVARRTHFNFLGWYDNEWKDENGENKIWGANDDYEFHTHEVNGGTRTIFALWERDTQPDASVAMEEKETGFDYTITATDLVAVKAVKYMIAADAPTATTEGWTEVTASNGKYVVTIPRTNDKYGKFLYAMVENEGQNIIVKYADPIRSFIDLEAIRDDKSKVENGSWEGEGDNRTWHPDGTFSYTYYSTYYNSAQAYKPVDATAYKVIIDSNNKLSLANITSTEPITDPENADGDGDGDGPATPASETIIPKGEAVILQGVTSKITLELVDSDVVKSTDNKLEGADVPAQPSDVSNYDYYIFKYDTLTGMGFFKDNETQLAAHTAYLKLDKNAENPESYTLNFDDSTVTGIDDIIVNGTANGATYDLLGRKVKATNAKSGIYIKDGKKIFIKE